MVVDCNAICLSNTERSDVANGYLPGPSSVRSASLVFPQDRTSISLQEIGSPNTAVRWSEQLARIAVGLAVDQVTTELTVPYWPDT